jgi:hypothetical protein
MGVVMVVELAFDRLWLTRDGKHEITKNNNYDPCACIDDLFLVSGKSMQVKKKIA